MRVCIHLGAYILAPEWHPLIDGDMLGIVNEAFSGNGHRVSLGAIKIEPAETEKYSVKVRA